MPRYYMLSPENPRYSFDQTGTGNTLAVAHPMVLRMVLDSLRYWVQVMHVDGFRFDLASTLGREADGFDREGGFFNAIRQDPILAGVKLIAEPWDIGHGGYQVGGFPHPFREWNDKFRDTVRGFWRGDEGLVGPTGERPRRIARSSSTIPTGVPPLRSISCPPMTVSHCWTPFPTMIATTRRTARAAPMGMITTCPITWVRRA